MARALWKGAISFGLVTIPASLYPVKNARENVTFHQARPHPQRPLPAVKTEPPCRSARGLQLSDGVDRFSKAFGAAPGVATQRAVLWFDDIDGVYDERSRDAVMAFKKVERLARDGVAGPEVCQELLGAKTLCIFY